MKIDSGAEKVLRTLEAAGYEAFVVGGCVRDALMGREPDDWDITTNALPEEVKGLFRKTFDTGIQHGTVTVLEQGGSYEVTTYRIDGEYTDHRRPNTVSFASSLYEDVARRDFTINAMAYHPGTGLMDYFEGQEDLKKRQIRCVGDPMQRFDEDALRMLRAVRFSAKLDFTIDPETWRGMEILAPTLKNVSKERILEEITKTLMSAHPEGLKKAAECGLMRCFVENAPEGMKDGTLADFVSPGGVKAKRVLRFAALLHRLEDDQLERYLKTLKSDNELSRGVRHLVAHLEDDRPKTERDMRFWLHVVGREYMEDLLDLRRAVGVDSQTRSEHLNALLQSVKDAPVTMAEMAVDGRILIAQGAQQGKQIGEILNYLLEQILEDPLLNQEETLISLYHKKYDA